MDPLPPEFPYEKPSPSPSPSPRKELQLQGPRPPALKVSKESHKIKKPPVFPPQAQAAVPQSQHPPPPVIIYSVSPKVIYTNPDDFMKLVQRLTGQSSPSSSFASASASAFDTTSFMGGIGTNGPPISPAARLATIEKKSRQSAEIQNLIPGDFDIGDQLDIGTSFDRTASLPGILSPIPSSLPSIPSYFFSPSTDPNSLSFLHEFSPNFHENRYNLEGSFITSPTTTFLSPTPIPSPTLCFDLFNF